MKTLNITLTDDEAFYLCSEMNVILRSYKQNYRGQQYDNPDMGSAFNKVFKSISGRSHEQYEKYHKSL